MNIKHFLFLFLSFFFLIDSQGQIELPEDKVSWTFTVEQSGCEATVIGRIKVVDHWHINAVKLPQGSFGIPTSIELKKSSAFQLTGGVTEPKPITKYDEDSDENLAYHEGNVVFKQKIKILSDKDFDLSGSFTFQTCNDVKCLPDYTADFRVKVKGCNADAIQQELKANFVEIKNDEARHKDGSIYVFVKEKWHKVPEGNSVEFYKKYLSLID